jgi:hypothetical protein
MTMLFERQGEVRFLKSSSTSMRWLTTSLVLLQVAMGTRAHAQQPTPPKLWSFFEADTPHTQIAAVGCALDVKASVGGRYRPIEVRAFEDGAMICTSAATDPDAVHTSLQMTRDLSKRPSQIIVEVEVPPGTTPAALADLRALLQNATEDLRRRALTPPPPVVQTQTPPPTPEVPVRTHRVEETNWVLIGAGGAVLFAGWGVSALVGAGIASSTTYPGTPTFWPFVPFIGMTVFSATYTEAPNCDCDVGRFFSVVGSVVIDAVQIAGVVLMIAGAVSPRTRTVRDALGIRFTPGGALFEGRF